MAAGTSEILRGNLCLAATRHLGWVVPGPCNVCEADIPASFSQVVHQSHAGSGMVIQYEVRPKPDQSMADYVHAMSRQTDAVNSSLMSIFIPDPEATGRLGII